MATSHPSVSQLMTLDPLVLHPEDRFERAAREMEAASIRHLPVVDREGRLLGLVSHRDVLAAGTKEAHRSVGEIMRTDIKAVAEDTPASEAAAVLLRYKIGCVPITDAAGRLIGI